MRNGHGSPTGSRQRMRRLLALVVASLALLSSSAGAATLHGTVSGTDGTSASPLFGATISVYDPTSSALIAQTSTALDGSYALTLGDGTYDVAFAPPIGSPYQPDRLSSFTVAGDAALDEVLAIVPGSVLFSGVVREADGSPAAGVGVGLGTQFLHVGADGAFAFRVPQGRYKVVVGGESTGAERPSTFGIDGSVDLEQDTVTDLRLPAAHQVTVRVTGPDGAPIAGASVHMDVNLQLYAFSDAIAMGAGSYEVGLATTGTDGSASMWLYDATAAAQAGAVDPPAGSGYGSAHFDVPAISADTAIDVTVPRMVSFSGSIHEADGSPAAGVGVSFGTQFVRAGSDGAFALQAPPGRYKLDIGGEDTGAERPTTFGIEAAVDLQQDTVANFALPVAHHVTIEVVGDDGAPIAGAAVAVNDEIAPYAFSDTLQMSPGAFQNGNVTTGADGTWSLWLYEASAQASAGVVTPPAGSGYGSARFDLPAITQDTTITVRPPRVVSFSGTVRESDGSPASGVGVGFGTQFQRVGSDGAFAFLATPGNQKVDVGGEQTGPERPDQFGLSGLLGLQQNTVADFHLPVAHRLTVRVVGDGGSPVVGATVGVNDVVPPYAFSDVFAMSGFGYQSDRGTTGPDGSVSMWLYEAPAQPSAGFVTPPPASGLGSVQLDVPAIVGDTTISVALQRPNVPPVARLAGPASVFRGDRVTFDAGASTDADGSIVRYEWDLDGNGSFETGTGTTPTATTTFSALGSAVVRVRVTDDRGGQSTASSSVTVLNHPPIAEFGYSPASPTAATNVQFTSSSSDPDGSIVLYEWDLNGDGVFETTGATRTTASKRYLRAGTYEVSLRVTDSDGATTTVTHPVTVACLVETFGVCRH